MMEEKSMRRALALAQESFDEGEVPVGAVVVLEGKVVGTGRNRREKTQNALCHAEIEAIHHACAAVGSWRLCECDLYVTLEPCPMCAGAAINARIRTVYFGTPDPKGGAAGSLVNLFELPFNHKVRVVSGLCAAECGNILSRFFAELRKEKTHYTQNGETK